MKHLTWVYPDSELLTRQGFQEFRDFCDRLEIKGAIIHIAQDDLWSEKGDFSALRQFIADCHTSGLETHGMVSALTDIPKKLLAEKYRDWFTVDYHGISCFDQPIAGQRRFLDPQHPGVQQFVAETVGRLLREFPDLSGVQLDFIRYYSYHSKIILDTTGAGHDLRLMTGRQPIRLGIDPEQCVWYFPVSSGLKYNDPPIGGPTYFQHRYSYCFCDACVAKFAAKHELSVPHLASTEETADWIFTNHSKAWAEFRADNITSLLRQVRQVCRTQSESTMLSCTVWYNAPYGCELMNQPLVPDSAFKEFGQAWWQWAEEGIVDFLCPMDYWLSPRLFADVVTEQVARLPAGFSMFAGILHGPEYQVSRAQMRDYLEAIRRAGAAGACLFHYGTWRERSDALADK